ncbi:importin-4-like [Culicoides brevitarsis]|uniref:importin-4-like n=1 Tax=Culicoides brevitarsis TaxID=469753 RepID=UPI00307BA9DB
MENIIKNLLVADSEVISKATAELQEAFKRPETVPLLCDLVVSNPDVQVRQYAATLLRKRLGKLKNWQLVAAEHQAIIRNGMLRAISTETERPARNAITAFVGVLVRHEFGKNHEWEQQVLSFVFDSIASNDPATSELGAQTFATLTDNAPDQFVPHLQAVFQMYSAVLTATAASGNMTSNTVYHILVGVGHLIPFSFGELNSLAERTFTDSIPYVLQALNGFAAKDGEQFINAFDILENLAEENVKVVGAHLQHIVEFCLAVVANAELEDSVRVKTVTYLGWLIRLRKKQIIKLKLVDRIIHTLFELMSSPVEDDDEEEEYFGSNEVSTPMTCATQTMDVLALNVPPKQLIPSLLALLEPALKGDNPLHKKASYLCIAVIAEGCSEAICSKYLRPLLDCIKVGIVDQTTIVRNAALFALGQFSEHLQPEISQYASEILPILFRFLQELCLIIANNGEEPAHLDRVFYALETYCENLEDALIPYLPELMERLIEALNPKNSVHLRELALSAVTCTTNAAKSNMVPYFQKLIELLKPYLVVTEDPDIETLRPHAIDTLAALARQIGKENFMVIANDTMNIGFTLLQGVEEPETRRACYNLFASISATVNEMMAQVPLDKIVGMMIESVKSTEGIIPTFKEDDEALDVVDTEPEPQDENQEIDIEQSDDEEDDDDDIAGYSVENAYMDEKEEAILALCELAEHTGTAFAPYLATSFEEIYKCINFPNEDIRRVSVEALKQFVISLFKLGDIEGSQRALLILIPKLSELIRTDEERLVVIAALDAFNEILRNLKGAGITADGQKEAIFGCITDVLNGKVACQYEEQEAGQNEDAEESEYDEAIIEQAGDILPRFGLALNPAEFSHYFSQIFPFFIHKIEKTKHKDETTDSQRAFAIGVLSECFEALKDQSSQWFDTLLPIFLSCVNDRNDEVRNNTIFGLGEMVLYAGEIAHKYFPQILAALSQGVSNESHAGTLDNICGALARLILANSSLVPLNDVLPSFIQYLPLREDFDENQAIFKAFALVYQQGNDALLPLMDKISVIGLTALAKKQYSEDETRDIITSFLRQVAQDFPAKFQEAANSDPELLAFVQQNFN